LESQESEDSPLFLPDGDLIYRTNRGGKNYLYTKKQDGTGERKLVNEPILDVEKLSPDGKWVVATRSNNEDEEHPIESWHIQPGKEHRWYFAGRSVLWIGRQAEATCFSNPWAPRCE